MNPNLGMARQVVLPNRVWLRRADVLEVVGGRRELERLEAADELHRVQLRGYTMAHYSRKEVVGILDRAGVAVS